MSITTRVDGHGWRDCHVTITWCPIRRAHQTSAGQNTCWSDVVSARVLKLLDWLFATPNYPETVRRIPSEVCVLPDQLLVVPGRQTVCATFIYFDRLELGSCTQLTWRIWRWGSIILTYQVTEKGSIFPSMGSVEGPWIRSSTDDWRMALEMIVTFLDFSNLHIHEAAIPQQSLTMFVY